MSNLIKLSGEQIELYFKELRKREVVIKKPTHDWHKPSKLPWLTFCEDCGLVWGKNKRTTKAIQAGCTLHRLNA